MLEVRDVRVFYGKHAALQGVSLEVRRGETVVILGANGAGKTTLLNTISGLVPSEPGSHISFSGATIHDRPAPQIVEAGISLVPEGRRIFGDLSVHENLRLGGYPKRARAREAQNLDHVLTLFPRLAERRNQAARTMSGGEQQMLAIARALMAEPELILLDEPSIGLSPRLTKELFAALAGLRDDTRAILLVEQNAQASLRIADRAYLLENGHIARGGDAKELRNDPAVQRAYLGLE
ncbi:MAG: ABC transporter ATP-binding protein [Sneathiellaceae bacterium]